MKYKFYFSNGEIDDVFIADLTIVPEEKEIIDGPSDNWKQGFPAEINVNEIYFRDNPAKKIEDSLYSLLKKEIEKDYDAIISLSESE